MEIAETIGSHESFRTLTGQVDVYDRTASDIGEGWEIAENDQLVVSTNWVTVLFANGSATRYNRDNIQEGSGGGGLGGGPGGGPSGGSGGPAAEGLIEHSDGTFTYTTKSKGELKFDSSGKITSRSDHNNNTSEYTYTSGNLTKITRQDGREITLAYSSGQLSTITDWAGRVTTLTHNGSDQVTRITAPDPDAAGPLAAAETDFTYDSGNQLIKTIVDPGNNTTTFNYDVFDRLSSVVYPGSDTYNYSPQIVQGLVASGGGTSGSPASLPSASPRGSVTDPLSNTTYVRFDPLGFELEVEDATGHITTWERNDAGYPTKLTAPDPEHD
ncbi:MAG: hypothetical protein AAGJ83_05475 [Planctomycetota bacterium]